MAAQGGLIYSQDFESGSLDAGWIYGVNTFTSGGGYIGGWFIGASPVSAVVESGQSGPSQGTYVLKTYGDYGYAPNYANNQIVETIVYREHVISAAEAALGTASLAFDYKAWPLAEGGIDGVSTANVFLKVIDPSAGYATVALAEQSVTASDVNWNGGALSFDISGYEGALLQWGTSMTSQNYSPTAIATDNFNVAAIPEPTTIGLMGIASVGMMLARRKTRG